METKDQRRKRKLELLIAATDGGLEAIAIASGCHPNYLQQILRGTLLPAKKDGTRSPRALGDKAAEAIEDAYKLGRGWFDSAQAVPGKDGVSAEEERLAYKVNPWPFASVTTQQFAQLQPSQKALIEQMILQFLVTEGNSPKQLSPGKTTATV
jgi:hypothetical protein